MPKYGANNEIRKHNNQNENKIIFGGTWTTKKGTKNIRNCLKPYEKCLQILYKPLANSQCLK